MLAATLGLAVANLLQAALGLLLADVFLLLLLLVLLVACGHADARPPQVDVRDGQATGQADGTLGHFSFELAFDEPELGQLFQVHTRIRDLATGELLGDASLEVDCTMPSHGHGMMTSPRTRPGTTPDEAYTSAGMKLHMLGPWQFQLDATHGDRRDFALLDYDYLPGP